MAIRAHIQQTAMKNLDQVSFKCINEINVNGMQTCKIKNIEPKTIHFDQHQRLILIYMRTTT